MNSNIGTIKKWEILYITQVRPNRSISMSVVFARKKLASITQDYNAFIVGHLYTLHVI
jgi:hypothetical protein